MVVKKEETRDFMELVHQASGMKKGKSQAPLKKETPPMKKSIPMKKDSIASIPQKKEETDIEKILIENFVSLQKVMTNLAVKFDSLSEQISKLLELFEISAKTLAEKGYSMGEDKKILEKLDSLLEHNKVIAKGIALLHERNMPEEEEVVIMPSQPISPTPQMPMPRIPPQQPMRTFGAERNIQMPDSSKQFTTEA